jgi:hypothetical protein
MQIDAPPKIDQREGRLHQMAASIEALNARIAVLAIGLGVSLKSDDDVARVLSRPPASAVPHERRTSSDPGDEPRMGAGPDRRTAHRWEELRGLLVLRYDVQTRCVDEVGVIATYRILIEAEEHLMRRGFNAGDTGINLGHLFDVS